MAVVAIEAVREALAEVLPAYHVRRAYLFGSQARGEATRESDVDLAFEEYVPYSIGDLYAIKEALRERLGADVDIISYPGIRSRLFRRSVDRDKVEVYVRNPEGSAVSPCERGASAADRKALGDKWG